MPLMMSHFSPPPIDTPALRVQGLGVQECMRPVFFDRPRGWPHYLFVLFNDEAICQTRKQQLRVPPGTLVCWRPGTPHGLGNRIRAWNHSWLSVSGRAVTRTLRDVRFPLDSPVPLHDASFFEGRLADLYEELSRPATGPDARDLHITVTHVTSLIRRLARALRPTPLKPRVPQALIDLHERLQVEYAESLTLVELAARAGLSVSQLCLLHKRHFGSSVMAHLRLIRLGRAAMLLRDSDLKVSTIAGHVGFGDAYHFNKAFRRHFGHPPGAFRAKSRSAGCG